MFGWISQAAPSAGSVSKISSATLIEKFKVLLAGHSGTAHIILDDEYWDTLILWNNNWARCVRSRENQMITLFPNTRKPCALKDTKQ